MADRSHAALAESRGEIVRSLEPFLRDPLDSLLRPAEESWQPSDFLPDMAAGDWQHQIADFQERAKALPKELLVVLVGDMITEEALPSYQTWLNRLRGIQDSSGTSDAPVARWSRGWTAEENRHGDLLNKYLYLTGRVDMRAVETSIHDLINNGFDPQTGDAPYLGIVYTSFQERATKISHRHVGEWAKRAGEDRLQRICGMIAADEARHERAYKLFMAEIFTQDPNGAVLAFARMTRTRIVLPSHLLGPDGDSDLLEQFSRVAQKAGVYTAADYARIIATLVAEWNVGELRGLSDEAAEAQEYLGGLSQRYQRLAERMERPRHGVSESFRWIFHRAIPWAS